MPDEWSRPPTTIGPGLFFQADRIIGGADGTSGRGMQRPGCRLRMTLRHGPDPWVPSSFMPTRPGRPCFLQDLAGPLEPEMNQGRGAGAGVRGWVRSETTIRTANPRGMVTRPGWLNGIGARSAARP
jgi:hypothetical protein